MNDLRKIALMRDDEGWALRLPFPDSRPKAGFHDPFIRSEESTVLRGDYALQAASRLLPVINRSGATRNEVDNAVRLLGETPNPDALFASYATIPRFPHAVRRRATSDEDGRLLGNLPLEVRLALEMATHEDAERRALEGELALLDAAWREAEEIAAISDDMFVSEETRSRFSRLKRADKA